MTISDLTRDTILKVGIVSEVHGRIVTVKVDKNKNLTDIFLDGEIVKNISVNSFIEIRKGFLSIIGKIDGERIEEEPIGRETKEYDERDKNRRYLTVSLIGYIGDGRKFIAGTKELPLLGDEAYIVTKETLHQIHNLVSDKELSITIAKTDEDFEIDFPIDTLFNGHIAIFGNTGSGKSNTLAALYQAHIRTLQETNYKHYTDNTQFLLFDFNGEYGEADCITPFNKKVYKLSTNKRKGAKIPLSPESLLDIEILSILSDATEKTQKPFLLRTISLYNRVHFDATNNKKRTNPLAYFKRILEDQVNDVLKMSDKIKAHLLIDYLRQILPTDSNANGETINIRHDIYWHNSTHQWVKKGEQSGSDRYFDDEKNIKATEIYNRINKFEFKAGLLENFIQMLYVKLIQDVLDDRAQNDHIAPVVHRLQKNEESITKIFDTTNTTDDIWGDANFIVIDLNNVNLEMKKTLPLLLSKKIYKDHKSTNKKTLNIIIDEAHNILSNQSFRESENWKDYRLETFEEIIKEGRKFGVFVTISSQRPSDISPTITSQAHNYFIHRLINRHDLAIVSSAVSYIDRITEESIPTLPTGTCIFSGVASQRPIKVHITELPDNEKPSSKTIQFSDIVKEPDETNTF